MPLIPEKTLFFDDGYLDTYIYAQHVVGCYAYPKVVGVITDYVGKPITWSKYYGGKAIPTMGISHLKALIAKGWRIAGHSKTHPRMTQLSYLEAQKEIRSCYDWIRVILGIEPFCFIFPYTDYNDRLFKYASEIFPVVRPYEQSHSQYVFHTFYNLSERRRLLKIVNEDSGYKERL